MCGRFTLTKSKAEVAAAFDLGNMPELAPRYNIAPTQTVFAVRQTEEAAREGVLFRWGLTPAWSGGKNPLFNARADTAATKPSFRSAFKKRRCLVPADGFYEWKAEGKKKLPHLFTVSTGLFAVAGLWEQGGGLAESVCLITTEANGVVGDVHDRMPVILPREAWSAWLDPNAEVNTLQSLLVPYPAAEMACRQVSDVVNSARYDGPGCLESAAPTLFG